MPTRHLPLLSGKVCFEGFVVRIEQMFSCRIFFHWEVMWSFTVQLLHVFFYLCSIKKKLSDH